MAPVERFGSEKSMLRQLIDEASAVLEGNDDDVGDDIEEEEEEEDEDEEEEASEAEEDEEQPSSVPPPPIADEALPAEELPGDPPSDSL